MLVARADAASDDPPLFLQAWVAFLTAHARVVPEVSDALEAACGVPLSWFDVLHQLRRSPGGRRRMHELAAAVLLSKSGLTRLVDRIEEAGLVARAAVPGDRRSLHVELTPAGRRLALQARDVVRGLVDERFAARLSGEELATLRDALGRVARAVADRHPPASAENGHAAPPASAAGAPRERQRRGSGPAVSGPQRQRRAAASR